MVHSHAVAPQAAEAVSGAAREAAEINNESLPFCCSSISLDL
jgi:hypothetical protein